MLVQMVIMLSTLLCLPLVAAALMFEHIRNDCRASSRIQRPAPIMSK